MCIGAHRLSPIAPHVPHCAPTRSTSHVGTDRRGVVHSLTTTDAAASEINQLPHLVHGDERALYGDRAYWSEADRQACEAAGIKYRMTRRGTAHHPLSERWRQINRARSSVRARSEFVFQVVKCQWKHTKVRYRGLAKNTAQVFTLFALTNLFLVRHRWAPA